MIKPIQKMYLYVIIFQSLAYALIFYIFETISTTDNPTKFMLFWVPVVFSVFVSFLLVRSLSKRIKKNGVKNLNYKNYIVSCVRKVSPPLLNKEEIRNEIKKDGVLDECTLVDEAEDQMKLIIKYSFFLTEIIYIDLKECELRLCSKPSVWYIYGPYGGGVQKIGYLESVVQNHYKKT